MAFDVEIDTLTGDLRIPTNLITGPALILQRVRTRLSTFFGEYLLNRFVGLPYLAWREQKPPDEAAIGAVVFAEISTTPGVIRVTSFAVAFDNATRALRIEGDVVIEGLDPADEAVVSFVGIVGLGNSTPAVISFHPVSGRIAGI